eukprot:354526-Chlamydomonas_euryale.AAC.11
MATDRRAEQVIVNEFQERRQALSEMASKINELRAEVAEHEVRYPRGWRLARTPLKLASPEVSCEPYSSQACEWPADHSSGPVPLGILCRT